MSYCNGSNMLLYLGEDAFGHCTTHTATMFQPTRPHGARLLIRQMANNQEQS